MRWSPPRVSGTQRLEKMVAYCAVMEAQAVCSKQGQYPPCTPGGYPHLHVVEAGHHVSDVGHLQPAEGVLARGVAAGSHHHRLSPKAVIDSRYWYRDSPRVKLSL